MANSIIMRAMVAIRDIIVGLDLDGLDDDRVRVRRLDNDGEHYHEGITIYPVPEQYDQGTNERELVGYGCAITMAVNNNNDENYKLDRLLEWRERIRRELIEDTKLIDVSTLCSVKVEMGRVLEWNELKRDNLDVSRMVVRVWSLETRT